MFLRPTVTRLSGCALAEGLIGKALGYLNSIASVFFLGVVAWPKSDAPWLHSEVLIVGMGCRYKAHLDEQREIRKAEAEARKR